MLEVSKLRQGVARQGQRIAPTRRALAVLAAALAPALLGCWGAPPPPKEAPPELTNSPAVVARAVYDAPGKLALDYSQGDYRSGDLVVPPGKYEIEARNVDSDVDVGFLLVLPDQYGRETNHLAAGGGIRKGKSRVFSVELEPRQTYLYGCPVTDSPKHLIRAVDAPQAPKPLPTPAPAPEPVQAEPELAPDVESAPAGDAYSTGEGDLYMDDLDDSSLESDPQ